MAVITVTNDNFETIVLNNKKPVLVDFWAEWCMPCRAVAPIVEDLASDLAGDLVVAKVNVDDNEEIAATYGIMSIPTFMLFKNGQTVDQIIGMRNKAQIFDMIKKHL